MFQLFAIGVVDTGGKFATSINNTSKFADGVVDTGSNLLPVSMIPVVHLVHLDLRREFSKKFETVLMGYFGAGGN